jgi:uncharacterized membrane protein
MTINRKPRNLSGTGSARPTVRAPLVVLGAIILSASALDLFELGARGLWLDEATSITFARLDWQPLLRILSREEANMSLYYGLLHVWVALGDSEFTIRLLSVLMALAAVGVIYLLGERLFSVQVGLVSALLLSVNAFNVAYAQEARSYSLLVLLVTFSSLAFLHAIEWPAWRHWAIYVAAGVLSVYAHFFGILVLLAHGTSLAFFDRRRVPWKHVFVSMAVIGLCLAPLALFALTHPGKAGGIAKPTRQDIFGLFYTLAGADPTGAKPLLLAYGLACMISIWVALTRRDWRYWFLLTWFGLPIALTLAVSVIKPLFVPYYLIVCLPPLVLLVASGLSTIPRWAFAIALIVTVGMALYEDHRYYERVRTKKDWRAAIVYAVTRALPGDSLFFYPVYFRQVYDYYRPATGPPVVFPQHWDWVRTAGYGEPVEGQDQALASIKDLPRTYLRVWLFSDYDRLSRGVRAALADAFPKTEERDFEGVRVTLYSRGR